MKRRKVGLLRRFGRVDSGGRVTAGDTGWPVTELTEPTEPGRFVGSVNSVSGRSRPRGGEDPRQRRRSTDDSSQRIVVRDDLSHDRPDAVLLSYTEAVFGIEVHRVTGQS